MIHTRGTNLHTYSYMISIFEANNTVQAPFNSFCNITLNETTTINVQQNQHYPNFHAKFNKYKKSINTQTKHRCEVLIIASFPQNIKALHYI